MREYPPPSIFASSPNIYLLSLPQDANRFLSLMQRGLAEGRRRGGFISLLTSVTEEQVGVPGAFFIEDMPPAYTTDEIAAWLGKLTLAKFGPGAAPESVTRVKSAQGHTTSQVAVVYENPAVTAAFLAQREFNLIDHATAREAVVSFRAMDREPQTVPGAGRAELRVGEASVWHQQGPHIVKPEKKAVARFTHAVEERSYPDGGTRSQRSGRHIMLLGDTDLEFTIGEHAMRPLGWADAGPLAVARDSLDAATRMIHEGLGPDKHNCYLVWKLDKADTRVHPMVANGEDEAAHQEGSLIVYIGVTGTHRIGFPGTGVQILVQPGAVVAWQIDAKLLHTINGVRGSTGSVIVSARAVQIEEQMEVEDPSRKREHPFQSPVRPRRTQPPLPPDT